MNTQIAADEATRLCRLLGMLGSAYDGEVLNAARLADRFVRELGLTWSQIILPTATAGSLEQESEPQAWRDFARWIIVKFGNELREKEAHFVGQMTTWRGLPSEKQQNWLKTIAERYGGAHGSNTND